MKRLIRNICIIFVGIIFLTSIQALSVGSASDPNEDLVLGFIQNVLPIDASKYDVTLTRYGDTMALYTLKAEENVFTLNCYIKNNILRGCNLYVKNGSIIYDKPYASIGDVATSFLEKYQAYIKRDSAELENMLSNVDITKNLTKTIGNIKVVVTAKDAMGAKYTNLDWRWTFEGVDYPIIRVAFENDTFYSFMDSQSLYSIGDTTVNISKEQAINIALEYVKTYSYVVGDYHVNGLNVNENRTVAKSTCGVRNSSSSVLYPMWHVIAFLDRVYPGSIKAFQVAIWAKTGEVFGISPYVEPGSDPQYYDPNMDPQLNDISGNLTIEKSNLNSSLYTYLVIAAVIITVPAIVVVFLRKKNNQ